MRHINRHHRLAASACHIEDTVTEFGQEAAATVLDALPRTERVPFSVLIKVEIASLLRTTS